MEKLCSDKYFNNESLLLSQFNNRDDVAFSHVYISLYDELYFFADRTYDRDNIISFDDIIQDVFVGLWENKKQKFNAFQNIKAYVYIAIKNRYLNHIRHLKHVQKHINYEKGIEDKFVVDMASSEILSFISSSETLLPSDCAEIFKLSIEGWDIKEIADKLGITDSAIYKRRNKAIKILRKTLSK